jgi:hypothetical protein
MDSSFPTELAKPALEVEAPPRNLHRVRWRRVVLGGASCVLLALAAWASPAVVGNLGNLVMHFAPAPARAERMPGLPSAALRGVANNIFGADASEAASALNRLRRRGRPEAAPVSIPAVHAALAAVAADIKAAEMAEAPAAADSKAAKALSRLRGGMLDGGFDGGLMHELSVELDQARKLAAEAKKYAKLSDSAATTKARVDLVGKAAEYSKRAAALATKVLEESASAATALNGPWAPGGQATAALNRLRGGKTAPEQSELLDQGVKLAAKAEKYAKLSTKAATTEERVELATKAAAYSQRAAAIAKKVVSGQKAPTPARKQWQQGDIAELTGLTGLAERFNGRAGFVRGPAYDVGILGIPEIVEVDMLDYDDAGASFITDERVKVSVDHVKDSWPEIADSDEDLEEAYEDPAHEEQPGRVVEDYDEFSLELPFAVQPRLPHERQGTPWQQGDMAELAGLSGEAAQLNGRAGFVASGESEDGRVEFIILHREEGWSTWSAQDGARPPVRQETMTVDVASLRDLEPFVGDSAKEVERFVGSAEGPVDSAHAAALEAPSQ